ncbi:MAG: TRAP transporter substrate-binding protein DctP [Desulfopila sp.]
MKKLIVVSISVLTLAVLGAPAGAAVKMRVSHQLPPAHHVAKVIDRWAAEIEKASDGEIDVQVFGTSSLVGARENAMAVISGNIECAFTVSVQWGKTIPAYSILSRPYTVAGTSLVKTWPTSAGAKMLEEKLAEKRMRNVVWILQSDKSIYTSNGKFLQNPSDFKGLKIRGLNPIMDAGIDAMGASSIPISGADVYQALATGVIDAADTGLGAAYARKYYEVQDHGTVASINAVFWNGYVNPGWYDGLSDKAKEALRVAGLKAADWAYESYLTVEESTPDQLREAGMQVHIQTPEEQAAWAAIMQPAFDKVFFKEAGDDGHKILALVKTDAGAN